MAQPLYRADGAPAGARDLIETLLDALRATVRAEITAAMPRAQRGLSKAQVAERLTLSPDTVDVLLRRGDLPHIRVGSRVIVPESAVDELLLSGREIDTQGAAA